MKMKLLFAALAFMLLQADLSAQISLGADRVVVTNERRINSEELEFSPVFYKDGIVFISTRFESLQFNVKDKNMDGKNIMSIYRAQRDDEGFLQNPVPLADELLFRYHEGPVTFDRTANIIFFTRNESLEVAADGKRKLQVFGAEKDGETWGNVQKLPFNNINYNYAHPTLSANQDMMVVASDLPGGYGGMDLYAVYQIGGKWVQLINLGNQVNTSGNEVFPHLATDGTLYFSSDGLSGFGGLDIFFTTENKQNETWGKPVNLGPPFNSPADDIGLIVDQDNKNGYFSSDRKGGYGGDDIYNFHIDGASDLPVALLGINLDGLVVRDKKGNPVEGAIVGAINFQDIPLYADTEQSVRLRQGDGEDDFILDVNSSELGERAETDIAGEVDMDLRRGNYVLKVAKEGYLPKYLTITPETDLSKLNIRLERAVNCVALKGKVMRENSTSPVAGAAVKIVDVKTLETITIYSDAFGNYEYCIGCDRSYTVYAEKDGEKSAPGIVNTQGMPCSESSEGQEWDIHLGGAPFYAGMIIRLPNIYFNYDDARLRPDAYRDLDEVVAMLRAYPSMKLELASHTDSRGGKEYNSNLSQRRSISVMEYLVNKGISVSRLQARGYGEAQLRNRCSDGVACSESQHQYNRRTEVKIIELDGPTKSSPPVATATEDVYRTENVAMQERDANEGKGGQDGMGTEVKPVLTAPPVPSGIRGGNRPSSVDESTLGSGFGVIAGTFANHDNAIRRAKHLTSLGYYETNIVRQSRTGLYAVYVDTFGEKNQAFSLVKKLAGDQLHAYVLRN